MAINPCPVKKTSERISEILASGRISQPRCREWLETLLKLLDDVSGGRAKTGHLSSMKALAQRLMDKGSDKTCIETGQMVSSALEEYAYIFLSHVEAHYCPTGECTTLSAAPCQLACPASVDAPSYVALVGMGRYREALEILREYLPFPGSLGRVCVRPCERACRRGNVDAPIAICQLKRVAFDKAYEEGMELPKPTEHRFMEKVAIIGSGPAGLSTGYFLAKKGYRPTIFESMPEPGGMLRWGLPAYRLPRDTLQVEIDYIKVLGVDIRTNVTFGKDITIDSLKDEGYESVFLGIGAWCSMPLPIEGAEGNTNVIGCLTFLRHENDRRSMVGKRVIVVGGGNVAIDCVRTALRLDVDEVRLVYRRSKREMPAISAEFEAAEEEGAIFTFLSAPIKVHGENGRITGLECIRNRLSEPDASGRRRPVPIEGSEYIIPADTIISAIGQEVDMSSLVTMETLELSRDHLIVVNPATLETSIPGVFAGGDAVSGPATVVEAVASGRKAAESIHRHLRWLPPLEYPLIPARHLGVPVMEISAQEKSSPHRPAMPQIDLTERKKNFREVELGLSEESASKEARRCLRCDICISCGRCIEVCRDEMDVDAIHLSYVEQHGTEETDFIRSAEKCIGCGSCAVNCPTDAITIKDQDGERRVIMCGAEMSRDQLVPCASCGIFFATQKHLNYIRERADEQTKIKYPRNLCPACARADRAKNLEGHLPFY